MNKFKVWYKENIFFVHIIQMVVCAIALSVLYWIYLDPYLESRKAINKPVLVSVNWCLGVNEPLKSTIDR